MERCAGCEGVAAFEAGACGFEATDAGRFATTRYQALAASKMRNAAIPSASGANEESRFGLAGFATAGAPTSSE